MTFNMKKYIVNTLAHSRAKALPIFYTFSSFVYAKVCDMIMRNHGHALVAIFIRIYAALGGASTKGLVSDIKITLTNFSSIANSQGIRGLVLYLKVCYVCLQQNLCGHTGLNPNAPRVSKTRSGIPRVFPKSFRIQIHRGRAIYIRLALTLLSLYRDLTFKGKMKLNSITDSSSAKTGTIQMMIGLVPRFVRLFVLPVSPKGGMRLWLKGRFSYFPISTSSPSSSGIWPGSHPINLKRAAYSLTDKQVKDLAILSKLSISKGVSPLDEIMKVRTNSDTPETEVLVNSQLPTGKLGLKVEAAGKIRVFAMIDPWSQWVLYPFHKGIFRILSKYPQIDGTFDQLRPLKRASSYAFDKGYGLFSMDLSSATDRLPIAIQTPLISAVFGFDKEEGDAWASVLVDRAYDLPKNASKYMAAPIPSAVKYLTGQPMGGYSSWPMLALTHHFIVQVAAWTTGVTSKDSIFKGYAVLGDDIVIYNSKVAKAYHSLILSLGVECNLSKSIISPKGLGIEFAKRIFLKGIDISPAPLKEFYSAMGSINALVEYGRKYHMTKSQLLKVAGFGYKVIASCNKPWNKIQNVKVKYIIFNDFITNPDVLTAALRAGSLGVSMEGFSVFLMTFASDFAFSLIERYDKLVCENHRAFNDLFDHYPKGELRNLHELWAIPYIDKLYKTVLSAFNLMSDKLVAFDYRCNDLLYPVQLRWNEKTCKYEGNIPERIKETVKFIQDSILVDKAASIYDPDAITPMFISPKVPKRPGFPGLYRIQLAWIKFFNLRRKLSLPSLNPVFIKPIKVDTEEMRMGSFMIPISILSSLTRRLVGALFFKATPKAPLYTRLFPWLIRKLPQRYSVGYRTLFWIICGDSLLAFITILLFALVVTLLREYEHLSWASFWPIWLTFSKTAISNLEGMKTFFHSWSIYYSSATAPYGTFSFFTLKYILFMSGVSTWFIGQADALMNCIDTVTLAYHDGFVACMGALTGRIYFWWVKPFFTLLTYPFTYAGGLRLGFNYDCLRVLHDIWIEIINCFNLLIYGTPLDP
jgi:hypothetical protein